MSLLPEEFLEDINKTFSAYISFPELRSTVEEAIYAAFQAALSGKTREEIITIAREAAAKLVTRVSDEMKMKIAQKIATGLSEQLGIQGTAALLREGLGLDNRREATLNNFKKSLKEKGITGDKLDKMVAKREEQLLQERAMTIAQYEMGTSMEQGNLENAKAQGATHKVWVTVTSGVCPDCAGNQAQGPIPIDDVFQSGDFTPCQHPRCLCALGFVQDTGEGEIERAREMSQERANRIAKA